MAYPTVDAPYGLKPVNLVGGLPFAGATRQIAIGNNYGTAMYNGDVVQLNSSGNVIITTLQNQSSNSVAGVIGVFLGCAYTNPSTKQKLFAQYYPGSIAADDIVAYVSDDPNALYRVVNVTSNVADSSRADFSRLTLAVRTRSVLTLSLSSIRAQLRLATAVWVSLSTT